MLGLKERMHQNLKCQEKASYLLLRWIVSVLYCHNGSKKHYTKCITQKDIFKEWKGLLIIKLDDLKTF